MQKAAVLKGTAAFSISGAAKFCASSSIFPGTEEFWRH
jgi:hypothetical protein